MSYTHRRTLSVVWLLIGPLFPAADVRAKEAADPGKKYALLVGVSEYASLRELPGARNDVVALRDALTGGGFDTSGITLMTNGSAGRLNPTAANIVNEVEKLVRKAREEDTVLLAFAGHGFQLKGESGNYFCAAESRADRPETMVPLTMVLKELAQCKSRRKVLMVDACRNDPFAEGERGKSWAKKVKNRLQLDLPSEGDIIVMFSCSPAQYSNEDVKLRHGVFFYYVIRGLLGEAAGKDGIVTVDSLLAYARPQVERHVRERFKETQVPLVRTIGEVPVIPLLNPARETRVQRLLQEAQKATQEGRKKEAVAKYTEAIEADARAAEAYIGRGKLYLKMQKYDAAHEDFSEALNLDRTNAEVLQLRGWVSRLQKDFHSALRDLQKAREMNSQAHEVADRIGCIYADDLNDQEKAMVYLNEAVTINPGYARAYFNRAFVHSALKKTEKAMSDFDTAVSLDPHNATFREYRADYAAYLERYDVAFKDGERASQLEEKGVLDPANQLSQVIESNTYIFQGDSYYNRGNYEQSTLYYQRAVAATDRAVAAMGRYNRPLDQNPLLYGNLQKVAYRIDIAGQSGDVGRYRAMTDRMINKLPQAARQQFRQQQQQNMRAMSGQPPGGFGGFRPQGGMGGVRPMGGFGGGRPAGGRR
jgi:tetratricopeptide (TPR) repeat protein